MILNPLQRGLTNKSNMAMTPQELERMNKLETLVTSLLRVESVPFINALERRLDFLSSAITLDDLTNVEGANAGTTGYVLKKTSTTWQPAPDIDT